MERNYIGNNAGIGLGVAGQVSAETEYVSDRFGGMVGRMAEADCSPPELSAAIERVQAITDNLQSIAEVLCRHADRILGPVPTNETGINKGAPEADNDIARLRSSLQRADAAAYRVRNQAERFARL